MKGNGENLSSGYGYGMSKDDSSILSELSDTTIEYNVNNISSICDEWSSKILEADLSSVNVESIFEPLVSVGVATSYIPSLKNALEKIESIILSVSNYVKQAAEEQTDIDEKESRKVKETSQRTSGGNYITTKSSDIVNEPVAPTPAVIDDTTTTNADQDLTIKSAVEYTTKMDYETFVNFMAALGSLGDGKLTDYLTTEDMTIAAKLKDLVLNCPNINEEFKAFVTELEPAAVQVLLQLILTNPDYVTDKSKELFNKYIESESLKTEIVAASKSNALLTNADTMFTEFNSIITKENLLTNLQEIYDGKTETTSDETTNFVRTIVDEAAKEKNCTYIEFFSTPSNEEPMKETIEGITKSLSLFRTLNTMDADVSEQIIKYLIG